MGGAQKCNAYTLPNKIGPFGETNKAMRCSQNMIFRYNNWSTPRNLKRKKLSCYIWLRSKWRNVGIVFRKEMILWNKWSYIFWEKLKKKVNWKKKFTPAPHQCDDRPFRPRARTVACQGIIPLFNFELPPITRNCPIFSPLSSASDILTRPHWFE